MPQPSPYGCRNPGPYGDPPKVVLRTGATNQIYSPHHLVARSAHFGKPLSLSRTSSWWTWARSQRTSRPWTWSSPSWTSTPCPRRVPATLEAGLTYVYFLSTGRTWERIGPRTYGQPSRVGALCWDSPRHWTSSLRSQRIFVNPSDLAAQSAHFVGGFCRYAVGALRHGALGLQLPPQPG